MSEQERVKRERIVQRLAEVFKPDYDGDPAEFACMTTFLANDGYNSIRALTFGEIADALSDLNNE